MHADEHTHASFLIRLRDRSDKVSWPEFQKRYGHMLYRFARSRGARHADAEDVVQDVQMQLFKAIDGFVYDGRKGRFRSYLRAAVLHALGRRAGVEKRQPAHLDPETFDYVTAATEAPADDAWTLEWKLQRLRSAVQRVAGEFDPTVLKAFEMHVLAGRTAAETAACVGLSQWGVYRAKSRVLKRVKEELAHLEQEEDRV